MKCVVGDEYRTPQSQLAYLKAIFVLFLPQTSRNNLSSSIDLTEINTQIF